MSGFERIPASGEASIPTCDEVWTVGKHPAMLRGWIVRPVLFGSRVRVLPEWEGGHVVMTREEDALLISAAPDLLEAAVEFVRKVEAGEARSTRSYAAFKVAIAKATTAAEAGAVGTSAERE